MKEAQTWFSNGERLAGIGLAAILTFLAIVLLVRLSGKRTTGNLNSFDWIITVAAGSLASSGILLRDIAVFDALFAITMLGICQYVLTRFAQKSERAAALVKSEPLLLFHQGEILHDNLTHARISLPELRAALRRDGTSDISDVAAIVLETNGSLSVLPKQATSTVTAENWIMADVQPPKAKESEA